MNESYCLDKTSGPVHEELNDSFGDSLQNDGLQGDNFENLLIEDNLAQTESDK
jgi:hypothetical protein